MAASDIEYSETRTIRKMSWDWLSDASGDYTQAALSRSGVIERVLFIPDDAGTAPTTLHDIVLNDTDDYDVLQGLGADLPAALERHINVGDELRIFAKEDHELYSTDGYSGSDADIDGTERFTSDIDLTRETGAAVDFTFDASGATDDLVISLYKTVQSSWDGDEIAIYSTTVDSDNSEDIFHFDITKSYGAGHYRFGMVRSGTTDTFDINVEMRRYHDSTFRGIAFDDILTLVVSNAGNAKGGTAIIYWR